MYLKKQFVIFFPILLFSDSSTSILDEYRNRVSQILIDTSNTIDCFFIENNDSVSSNTHAEFRTSLAKENYLKLEKDIRFKIRVDLPKIKKRLKLIIEDEHSDDALYDETRLQNDAIKDRQYYIRLEFLTAEFKNFKSKLSSGIRLRSEHIIPYVNHYANYKIYESEKLQSNFSNHFRFYTDGELEDYLDLSTVYKYSKALSGVWRNTLRYDETPFQTFFMDYSFLYTFNSKKRVTLGLGVTDIIKNFKDSKIDSYNLHASFFHLFHKNWMYYEVSPSILKRESNEYKVSYRLFLNFGIYFNSDS